MHVTAIDAMEPMGTREVIQLPARRAVSGGGGRNCGLSGSASGEMGGCWRGGTDNGRVTCGRGKNFGLSGAGSILFNSNLFLPRGAVEGSEKEGEEGRNWQVKAGKGKITRGGGRN